MSEPPKPRNRRALLYLSPHVSDHPQTGLAVALRRTIFRPRPMTALPRIYLDHNATTPVDPAVCAAMADCLGRCFGNPSSVHAEGQEARRALDQARVQVATLIGAAAEEIIFTSGGTEADNCAIFGTVEGWAGQRRHVVTSAIEHRAVLEPCRHLAQQGCSLTVVGVDALGRVQPAAIVDALREDSALVSVMLANNDVGTVQDVAAIAEAAHARGALVHSDAIQAAGKIPLDVKKIGVDLLSLSAHKLYGPKGAGALWVRRGVALAPLMRGGRQENRLRAGTENLPALVGFGVACEIAGRRQEADAAHGRALRDRFEQRVLAALPTTRIHGDPDRRLPHTSNLGFPGLDAGRLVIALDLAGVAASTGAACSAADREPSYVLLAMGCGADVARSSLRFSFGRGNTLEEADRAAELLRQTITSLRKT